MSDTVTTNEVVEEVPKEQEVQKEEAKEAHVNGNDDAATNEENLHPLESAWDFWYLSADKTKEWEERMTKVMTFNTVEDFWACYHHVSLPSKLSVGSDYMIFKSGIAPKWEDSKNEDGGKWVLETDKKYRCNVDGSWLETLLGCIGEGFEEGGEYVNGAVVQIRKLRMASKIFKANKEKATDLESKIAQALSDLETEMPELRDLYITSAKEVDAGDSKPIVVFVPHRQHTRFQRIQSKLVRELEKKFSGRHVTFVAQRTILSESFKRKPGMTRPRSRTLTAVHAAVLDDVVFPTQIVGQRIRYRADGSKLYKIYLDPKDVKEVDHKLATFSAVYKKLTNKNTQFLFPLE